MKIQLASTLPFSPVQLDGCQSEPRRAVGQLHITEGGLDFWQPVYEFRHTDDDVISYLVVPGERVFVEEPHSLSITAANDDVSSPDSSPVWVEHDESVSYKPYAFIVMNAMTRLVGQWDGVVYRTPSGERMRESAFQATLQVVDACVCPKGSLWVMVNLTSDNTTGVALPHNADVRQLGWVPVAC